MERRGSADDREHLEGLKTRGVKNPKAIYERARELVAKYDVEYRVGDK